MPPDPVVWCSVSCWVPPEADRGMKNWMQGVHWEGDPRKCGKRVENETGKGREPMNQAWSHRVQVAFAPK